MPHSLPYSNNSVTGTPSGRSRLNDLEPTDLSIRRAFEMLDQPCTTFCFRANSSLSAFRLIRLAWWGRGKPEVKPAAHP